MRDWPLDLVNYSYHNSHRSDLVAQNGYVPYSGGTRFISPRELEASWGARSPTQYDGGEGGRGVTPPTCWLEDYWMGRYYGFIEPPKTKDAAPPNRPAASARPERRGTQPRPAAPGWRVGRVTAPPAGTIDLTALYFSLSWEVNPLVRRP